MEGKSRVVEVMWVKLRANKAESFACHHKIKFWVSIYCTFIIITIFMGHNNYQVTIHAVTVSIDNM